MKRIVNKHSIWFVEIFFLFLISLMVSQIANAEEAATSTGFTYSVNFPENQMEKNVGYFKLKMVPEQEQEVSIVLSNPNTEKMTIDVGLNSAKTNQNGVIEYGNSPIENDSSLKFDFKDIVTGPKSIELAPGETKNLELKIKMPKTSFKGMISGGIELMKANQEGAATNKVGSKVINQYAYVIGMVLQESDDALIPDLKLNKISAEQDNFRNSIFVNFSNIIATYVDDMTVEAQITKKGSENVLYERKQTAMRMAPNTFLNFPISMNGESMVSGKYVAHVLVTSKEQKWEWTEEFNITKEEADKFNERDVGLVQEKVIDWTFILLIVLGVVVFSSLLFSLLFLVRKKKQKKEATLKKERREQKKKQRSKEHKLDK